MEHYYAVIMAGGGGTRLWPLSRKERPKQFLRLVGDQSMYQIAIERILRLFRADHIFVVTIAPQVEGLHQEFPSIPVENFIIEPMPKGTASVVGLAAVHLLEKDPAAVMAILTADHIIENIPLFNELLEQGFEQARQDHLVTLGIEPTYPSTGYGYIRASDALIDGKCGRVEKFVEKPDEATARNYLESGRYFWNSGMFIWKATVILTEFKKQMPDLYASLDEIRNHLQAGDYGDVIKEIWSGIHPQTIDYGIMENAEDVVVLPARGLGWNDVGSWDSLFDILTADEDGNVISNEKNIRINSKNTLFHTENPDKLLALIDTEDLVIIDSNQALLVCKKGQTQKVKQVVEEIKKRNLDSFL